MTPEERFWSKVDRSGGTDACWPWLGFRNVPGYGRFCVAGRRRGAHHYALHFTRGPVPEGLDVLHRCDNPGCCNPAHLYAGTDRENVAEREVKGRNGASKRCGDNNGSRTHPERRPRGERLSALIKPRAPRGEQNRAAKLTEANVRTIRSCPGHIPTKQIAARFAVSTVLVRKIRRGELWKHVT